MNSIKMEIKSLILLLFSCIILVYFCMFKKGSQAFFLRMNNLKNRSQMRQNLTVIYDFQLNFFKISNRKSFGKNEKLRYILCRSSI